MNYSDLHKLLSTRLNLIADTELRINNPAKQLEQLQIVSEAIQSWHQQHRSQIPPRLNHFLTQSSLNKALDYIEGEFDLS